MEINSEEVLLRETGSRPLRPLPRLNPYARDNASDNLPKPLPPDSNYWLYSCFNVIWDTLKFGLFLTGLVFLGVAFLNAFSDGFHYFNIFICAAGVYFVMFSIVFVVTFIFAKLGLVSEVGAAEIETERVLQTTGAERDQPTVDSFEGGKLRQFPRDVDDKATNAFINENENYHDVLDELHGRRRVEPELEQQPEIGRLPPRGPEACQPPSSIPITKRATPRAVDALSDLTYACFPSSDSRIRNTCCSPPIPHQEISQSRENMREKGNWIFCEPPDTPPISRGPECPAEYYSEPHQRYPDPARIAQEIRCSEPPRRPPPQEPIQIPGYLHPQQANQVVFPLNHSRRQHLEGTTTDDQCQGRGQRVVESTHQLQRDCPTARKISGIIPKNCDRTLQQRRPKMSEYVRTGDDW